MRYPRGDNNLGALRYSLVLFVCMSVSAIGAEFAKLTEQPLLVDERATGVCSASLTGTIEPGDAAKIQSYVAEMEPFFDPGSNAPEHFEGYNGDGLTLCISGPGGSYQEALKIIAVLAEGHVWTVLPRGSECLSACAVAFMGGLYADESGRSPARTLMAGANLGFHAPSITLSGTSDMPPALVEAAYKTALNDLQGIVTTLLVNVESSYEASMRPSLLAAMLGTPPDDMFHVTTIDEIGRWRMNFEDGPNDSINLSEANLIQVCKNLMSWKHDLQSISTAEYRSSGAFGEVRIDKIDNEDPYSDAILWKYTLQDGMFNTECTFHVPPALQRIHDNDIRVDFTAEDISTRESTWPDTWQYLNPTMTLIGAAERAGGLDVAAESTKERKK